ncbi:MAG: hypothetical protein LUD54_04800 [Oscillospiraceae bacterium]|nr:hypothetical protein [Oscillospiraceae bacterium]
MNFFKYLRGTSGKQKRADALTASLSKPHWQDRLSPCQAHAKKQLLKKFRLCRNRRVPVPAVPNFRPSGQQGAGRFLNDRGKALHIRHKNSFAQRETDDYDKNTEENENFLNLGLEKSENKSRILFDRFHQKRFLPDDCFSRRAVRICACPAGFRWSK